LYFASNGFSDKASVRIMMNSLEWEHRTQNALQTSMMMIMEFKIPNRVNPEPELTHAQGGG